MQNEENYKILKSLQFTVMQSTQIFVLRYILLHKALLKCSLTVPKVSVVRLIENIQGVSKVRPDCKLCFAQRI